MGSGKHLKEMVIEARPRRVLPEWKELWEYRELAWFLTWRDLKVRYKQTILGIAWAVVQPVAATLVFTLFFGRLANMPSDGVAYPVFALTALVPWTFFSNGLALCSNSLVDNAQLVAKVYFPRVLLPLAAVVSGLVDLLISFAVLLGLLFFYGYGLSWSVLLVPLLTLIAFVACVGVGVLFAALNARYRDVRYLVPFILQIWLFISPIAYPASLLPEPWLLIYGLNPMVGVVEGFRWALLGTGAATPMLLLVSTLSALALFIIGQLSFRRMERTFADVI
jgi:lipopolysaccharide transport system permease protein